MINKNDQKRIVTNEDIFDCISVLRTDISELRSEFKSDLVELRSEFKSDLLELRSEFKADLSELRASIVDGFDRVFQTMDDIRNELKEDIFLLRKETNQRFTIVENRLSYIENNMVYRHELSKLFA